MIQQPGPAVRTGFGAPVANACSRAALATDGFIDRYRWLRAAADFDVRKLLSGGYTRKWQWIAISVIVTIAVVIVVLKVNGQLDDLYLWIRQHDPFPGDRQYTHVMRDHAWIYLVPAGFVHALLLVLLPRPLWLNDVLIIMCSWPVGFIGGHVFW
jgi:hypothetical protein